MPEFEDAVGDMVNDLHAAAGRTITYFREGVNVGSLTMSRHLQLSTMIDDGQGGLIEVLPVDFIGKTGDLPVDEPRIADRIKVGDSTYEVLPTTGEKVFRRISNQMTRIHTKQVVTS